HDGISQARRARTSLLLHRLDYHEPPWRVNMDKAARTIRIAEGEVPMGLMLCALLLAAGPHVESKFEQVLPEPPLGKMMARTPNHYRAAVLIHGLFVHPFSQENVGKPLLRDWQRAESRMVKEVGARADVFSFAYAQNVGVDLV